MCKICGRSSCAPYMHSIEEQEAYEEAQNLDTRQVMYLIIENKNLEAEINQYSERLERCKETLPQIDLDVSTWIKKIEE